MEHESKHATLFVTVRPISNVAEVVMPGARSRDMTAAGYEDLALRLALPVQDRLDYALALAFSHAIFKRLHLVESDGTVSTRREGFQALAETLGLPLKRLQAATMGLSFPTVDDLERVRSDPDVGVDFSRAAAATLAASRVLQKAPKSVLNGLGATLAPVLDENEVLEGEEFTVLLKRSRRDIEHWVRLYIQTLAAHQHWEDEIGDPRFSSIDWVALWDQIEDASEPGRKE